MPVRSLRGGTLNNCSTARLQTHTCCKTHTQLAMEYINPSWGLCILFKAHTDFWGGFCKNHVLCQTDIFQEEDVWRLVGYRLPKLSVTVRAIKYWFSQ